MRAPLPALLASSALLLAACTGTAQQERSGPEQGAQGTGCPARAGLAVPALPTAETTGRLVPDAVPARAVVCRYAPVAEGAQDAALQTEAPLTAGLEALPQDLALPVRPAATAPSPCPDPAGPVVPLLLRLEYPDGVVWVGATEEPDGCAGATNGRTVSAEHVGDVLAASAAAGRWTVPPLPDAEQRCVPARTGRLAQAGSLLPQGVRTLTLCRVAGDGVTRRTATPRELAEVQDVLSEPVAVPQGPRSCQGGEQYELAAEYAAGPAVLVSYGSGCDPDVDNGSLQADLAPAERARLEVVLSRVA